MADNSASILNSTKKALGIDPSYDVFDDVLIMHINSVFTKLQQIGVGPVEGFEIEDDSATWDEFVEKKTLNSVKSYMYLNVRLLFDPPTTSHAESAMQAMSKEVEWRLNVHAESPAEG